MHTNTKNLTGMRFGRLRVSSISDNRSRSGNALWKCVCDCGLKIEVVGAKLVNGKTKSCGCLRIEVCAKLHTLHGMKHTKECSAYNSAKGRCDNPRNAKFYDYGGRGIQFKFKTFEEFYEEVGPKPTAKHSLDRKQNDGHYEKGNIRWATPKQQVANRRPRSPDRVLCDLLVAYAKQVSGGQVNVARI